MIEMDIERKDTSSQPQRPGIKMKSIFQWACLCTLYNVFVIKKLFSKYVFNLVNFQTVFVENVFLSTFYINPVCIQLLLR